MSRSNPLTVIRLGLLAGAIGLGAAAMPAAAQDSYVNRNGDQVVTGPYGEEDVIVHAPREWMSRRADGSLAMSREVSYADLDMSTRDGYRELRERVRMTARDICEELRDDTRGDTDPLNQPLTMRNCVRDAIHGAMRQVRYVARDSRDDDEDRYQD